MGLSVSILLLTDFAVSSAKKNSEIAQHSARDGQTCSDFMVPDTVMTSYSQLNC